MQGLISDIRAFIRRLMGSVAGYIQIGVIAALVVIVIVVTRAPSKEEIRDRNAAFVSNPTEEVPLVSVVRPEITATTPQVATTGTVEVRAYVNLSTQVSGRVVAVSDALRPGGRFEPAEVLVRLETADFELSLAQAKADLASAEATLELRQAESDAAIRNYALLHQDDATGPKPVPKLVAKEPQIAQADAQLAAARARVRMAELALARTALSLPFAGYVSDASVEVGQLISAGQSFGRAYAQSAVEAVVPLSVDQLALITPAPGREATVTTHLRSYAAVVDRIGAELDTQSRFSRAYLRIIEPDLPLPGTFATIQITGAPILRTFELPAAARQINDQVWIVVDGKLRLRQPEVLATTPSTLVIPAFDYGSGVVTSSIPGARDGLEVRIEPARL